MIPTQPVVKRYLRYVPHLITYIDIMGFRQLVQKRSPNFISWAIRQLQQITVPNRHTNKHEVEHYVNFSDLIVHTVPLQRNRTENILLGEIAYYAMVQAALIEKGLLIRGVITVGEMERSYGVLFGPGLISAYETERNYAQYSRIIVDGKLLELIKSRTSLKALANLTRLDDDGLAFIDYLGFVQKTMNNDRSAYRGLLEIHKQLIQRNLLTFKYDKGVLSKYLWLRKYHNATVLVTIAKKDQRQFSIERLANNSQIPSLTQI
jgi:hypothetical protein